MQIWAESGKSALPICNYSQILYQFLTFTQNLKRSRFFCFSTVKDRIVALFYILSTLCLPLSGLFHEAINSNIFGYSIILRETTLLIQARHFMQLFYASSRLCYCFAGT